MLRLVFKRLPLVLLGVVVLLVGCSGGTRELRQVSWTSSSQDLTKASAESLQLAPNGFSTQDVTSAVDLYTFADGVCLGIKCTSLIIQGRASGEPGAETVDNLLLVAVDRDGTELHRFDNRSKLVLSLRALQLVTEKVKQ